MRASARVPGSFLVALVALASASGALAADKPQSLTQYLEWLRAGRSLEALKPFAKAAEKAGIAPQAPRLLGACSFYESVSEAQFEADFGPFSRAAGSLEDFELTNAAPSNACAIDSLESVDCTDSGITGMCTVPAVDAGDVLSNVHVDSAPARGAGWWEVLAVGPGFNGAPSRAILPNYFGDSLELTFPSTGTCAGPGNPKVVGFSTVSPYAYPILVDLEDATQLTVPVPQFPSSFVGMSCDTGIAKVTLTGTGSAGMAIDDLRFLQTQPPRLNLGGSYLAECQGDPTEIPLDGSGSSDPEGYPLEFSWSTDCPAGGFDDATSPTPILSLAAPPPCPVKCAVMLEVTTQAGLKRALSEPITLEDALPPVAAGGLKPVAPLKPKAPKPSCAAPTSRLFEAVCASLDACDLSPAQELLLEVLNHEVLGAGGCAPVVERIAVDCGERLDVGLVSAPCPSSGPLPARPALTVRSDGRKLIRGERIVLHLSAEDDCGNVAALTRDLGVDPALPCERSRPDGSCCPALGAPKPAKCREELCGAN